VISLALLPDGRRFLSAGADQTLRLWDLETGQVLRHFEGHSGEVVYLAVSPDGRRLLSGGDVTARLWDVESGQELYRFEGHVGSVWAVALLPDGRRALSAGEDATLLLWEVPELKTPQRNGDK
jgi:WD40 repeat protein